MSKRAIHAFEKMRQRDEYQASVTFYDNKTQKLRSKLEVSRELAKKKPDLPVEKIVAKVTDTVVVESPKKVDRKRKSKVQKLKDAIKK